MIPIRFLQMHLSLDVLAAQIIFRINLNATHNNFKTCDGTGSIHTVFKWYVIRGYAYVIIHSNKRR